ncbi:MAG: cyclic nucleotide-binding domain-containing protein [Bdellovibrio sp.]|nr:cyclic nucleotide-binding domain-containing protein [Bdellovibrio sp.]
MVEILKPSVELLKGIKLLKAFTDTELGELIRLGHGTAFEAYSNIVIEGELSWGLYLMIKGVVGIFKANKLSGELYDVGQLREGSFFGEMSLIDDNPRSATVRALTECYAFFISKEDFNRFLNNSKDLKMRFYETCIQNLVSRLRELDDNYVISQYQLWKSALKKEAA